MQYDVYRNLSSRSGDDTPYLLDVQADLLDELSTRVVVPLIRIEAAGTPLQTLNPVFEIEGQQLVLSVPELSGIALRSLGEKVSNLAARRNDIVAALDLLLTGI